MYCGSCLRDNALAAELIARGHDVTLLPLYTPLLTDEANVSRPQVLFGGISIYLQHKSAIFRRLPRLVDRLLDAPAVIRTFANRSVSVDARALGDLVGRTRPAQFRPSLPLRLGAAHERLEPLDDLPLPSLDLSKYLSFHLKRSPGFRVIVSQPHEHPGFQMDSRSRSATPLFLRWIRD